MDLADDIPIPGVVDASRLAVIDKLYVDVHSLIPYSYSNLVNVESG